MAWVLIPVLPIATDNPEQFFSPSVPRSSHLQSGDGDTIECISGGNNNMSHGVGVRIKGYNIHTQ